MISKDVFLFLSELKENNNREWFQENKLRYERSRKEFEKFLTGIIPELSKLDPELQSPDMKDCIFRIYKDIRFSKDKTPYKTNFGAFIARGGRKTIFPGYYIHIEPGGSMFAGGIYMPAPDTLKLLRNEVYFNSVEFKKILSAANFKKYFGQLAEWDKMKKAPREYPADFPDIDLLKYRSYTVAASIPDGLVTSAEYKQHLLELARTALPLNLFLNRAISNG